MRWRHSLAGIPVILAVAASLTVAHDLPASHEGIGQLAKKATRSHTMSALPASFEANMGQTDESVRFVARADAYSIFFMDREAVVATRGATAVSMRLIGASQIQRAALLEPTGGISNYLVGNNPKKWRTNIAQYASLRYAGVYPGIDEVFRAEATLLEFDFVVRAGADPGQIEMEFDGAKRTRVDPGGDLVIETNSGELRLTRPRAYQQDKSGRTQVGVTFCLRGANHVAFRLGPNFDRRREVIIDPVIGWSTYLGGTVNNGSGGTYINANDIWPAITTDSAGNAYVAGAVTPSSFPVLNPYQGSLKGGRNAFISKISADGSKLIYSTYLGGSSFDQATCIAVDSGGNAHISGVTQSTDFPTLNAIQYVNNGSTDAFVAELNSTGSSLMFSTYLGGKSADAGAAVATDLAGNTWVTGTTQSDNFPILNALQPAFLSRGGDSASSHFNPANGFVAKIGGDGALLYSTYLGGTGVDGGTGIAVDPSGNAYVVGSTSSTDFPLMNALQKTLQGVPLGSLASYTTNAFVAEFNPAGSGMIYSTYLGGGGDFATGIAVDSSGSAYITGLAGTKFPTKAPLQLGGNVFAAKLSAAGQSLIYSTRVGATVLQLPSTSIAVDGSGNSYITGTALAPLGNLPILNAIQPGVGSVFVIEINALGSAVLFSTYLGGSTGTFASSVALDTAGNVFIGGITNASDFPLLHPLQPNPQNPFSVFVTRIVAGSGPPTITPGGIVPIYSSTPVIQPGSWVSIYGNNLASGTATWNGDFPVSLGGTSVNVNDKPAYLWYVSPNQINLQAPDDSATGSVNVSVTTAGGTATSAVVLARFGPALCVLDGKHAAGIISRSDGSGAYGGGTYDIIGPTGTSLGYKTVAAKSGDSVVLFGVGFGPTNPTVPAGKPYAGSAMTTNTIQFLINGTAVTPLFAGVTSAGLYQFNISNLPGGLGTGDVSLQATAGGNRTQSGVVLSLQ